MFGFQCENRAEIRQVISPALFLCYLKAKEENGLKRENGVRICYKIVLNS